VAGAAGAVERHRVGPLARGGVAPLAPLAVAVERAGWLECQAAPVQYWLGAASSGRSAMGAWLVTWSRIEEVRAALEGGAEVNARLDANGTTPLFRALREGPPGVVGLLLAHGADVEATLTAGWTPLWAAVRGVSVLAAGQPEWRRAKVRLLLRYRADPWRPTIGGRSPGEVALWGPLADLFADLPGAPKIPAADRDRQARADALIASYAWADQWSVGGGGIAFIHGVPADEVIRRFGGDPAGCPLIDAAAFGELTVASLAEPQPPATPEPVWVADVPGGAVAVQQLGCLLTRREVAAPVSRGGVLGSAFAGGNGAITVHIARDGQYVRWAGPIYDPKVGYGEPLEEERWCRFGAPDAPAGSMAQCLALMTMLTGIRRAEAWLLHKPKRVVMASPPT